MSKFTKKDVVEALDALVESKPEGYSYNDVAHELGILEPDQYFDPYYEGCEYTVENHPACIVGHVYHNLTGDLIQENFGWVADGLTPEGDPYRRQFTPAANKVLALAQVWQDKGHSWADALDKAKRGIEA